MWEMLTHIAKTMNVPWIVNVLNSEDIIRGVPLTDCEAFSKAVGDVMLQELQSTGWQLVVIIV